MVFVPIKYDLGGRIQDLESCRLVLQTLCQDVGEDRANRSWNLSYLRRQGVVLRGILAGGQARLAGAEWIFTRTLRIYPWLGVASVDYWFQTEEQVSITAFYDDMVKWRNRDYLPYLYDSGELTGPLAAHVGVPPTQRPSGENLHGDLIRDLRCRLSEADAVEERMEEYAFQDFRICFLVGGDVSRATVDSLLLLNRERTKRRSGSRATDEISAVASTTRIGEVRAASTGWSTVVVTGADLVTDPRLGADEPLQERQDLADLLSIFDLIHAQWYVCQLWINVADRFLTNHRRDLDAHVAQLRESQRSLTRDLADAGDLGLVFKDPELMEAARYLAGAFEVSDHKDAAAVRLQLLDEAANEIDQRRRLMSTDRLQVLFALSAASSLAALLPNLVEAGQKHTWIWFPTLLVVPLLWWIFTLGPRRAAAQVTTPIRGAVRVLRDRRTTENQMLDRRLKPVLSVAHRRPGEVEANEREQLSSLLDQVADDFVPPIYQRSSTTVGVLDAETANDESAYFREMLEQDNLLLIDNGSLVAFMSFKARYVVPNLAEFGEAIYVSTIAVAPASRKGGLAHALYQSVFDLPDDYPAMVILRTWSTNKTHIALITQKLGFELLSSIPDHRGPGIDTVYYGRRRED